MVTIIARTPSGTILISELEPRSHPEQPRGAGRVKSRLLDWKLFADHRKRARNEGAGVGESCRAELRGCVVVPVENVVHLSEQLEPVVHLVVPPHVEHGGTGRRSRSQIVERIRLMTVVLVAARVRARDDHQIELYR